MSEYKRAGRGNHKVSETSVERIDALRRFGPKTSNHYSIGKLCPACGVAFVAGDFTTLVALGPGIDNDARAKATTGRSYNSVATEVHWACATGLTVA